LVVVGERHGCGYCWARWHSPSLICSVLAQHLHVGEMLGIVVRRMERTGQSLASVGSGLPGNAWTVMQWVVEVENCRELSGVVELKGPQYRKRCEDTLVQPLQNPNTHPPTSTSHRHVHNHIRPFHPSPTYHPNIKPETCPDSPWQPAASPTASEALPITGVFVLALKPAIFGAQPLCTWFWLWFWF